MPLKRTSLGLLCGLAAAGLIGCQNNDDEIHRYEVTRDTQPNRTLRPQAAAAPRLRAPADWKKLGSDPKGLYVVGYEVSDGGQAARITVTPLGGSLLININRWRGQLGLPPATLEQMRADLQQLRVGQDTAAYVDLTGRNNDTHKPDRILGAILEARGRTWFFKMQGPPDLVGKQKADFELFVQSARFDDDGGPDRE